MTHEEFEIILKNTLDNCYIVLGRKSKEYSKASDKLYNFKRASEILNTTQQKALWGMAMKHLVSIIDIVEASDCKDKNLIDEKIGDMINYLILLKAVLYEQII